MTPLIAITVGDKVTKFVWLGCLSSYIGLGFLSFPVGNGGDDVRHDNDGGAGDDVGDATSVSMGHGGLGTGDYLVLFSAICWSFYILRTSRFGSRHDTIKLQGVKNFLLAILYTAWWWLDNRSNHGLSPGWKNPMVLSILLYSALFPGTIADVLQQNAQGSVPATESTVLLSTEPIFTAVLGFLLLGERLSFQESCGGAFLMFGTFLASC
jgi:drug/metabolite transporter (DMT)-like permease